MDDVAYLHCYLLGVVYMPCGHPHDQVFRMLRGVFDNFGVTDKIRGGTTDGASYFPLCFAMGGWIHLICVAHALQLVVREGLNSLGDDAVDQIRNLVKYFRTMEGARLLSAHQTLIRHKESTRTAIEVDTRCRNPMGLLLDDAGALQSLRNGDTIGLQK